MKSNGADMVMMTVQIRLTEKQLKSIDQLVKKGVYPNRSEAVRDAVRTLVNEVDLPGKER
jgi:Arc/MetJ-type ribon-helix-helix transcriptional regulator